MSRQESKDSLFLDYCFIYFEMNCKVPNYRYDLELLSVHLNRRRELRLLFLARIYGMKISAS
jgi:hypothetical protein